MIQKYYELLNKDSKGNVIYLYQEAIDVSNKNIYYGIIMIYFLLNKSHLNIVSFNLEDLMNFCGINLSNGNITAEKSDFCSCLNYYAETLFVDYDNEPFIPNKKKKMYEYIFNADFHCSKTIKERSGRKVTKIGYKEIYKVVMCKQFLNNDDYKNTVQPSPYRLMQILLYSLSNISYRKPEEINDFGKLTYYPSYYCTYFSIIKNNVCFDDYSKNENQSNKYLRGCYKALKDLKLIDSKRPQKIRDLNKEEVKYQFKENELFMTRYKEKDDKDLFFDIVHLFSSQEELKMAINKEKWKEKHSGFNTEKQNES